MGGHCIEISSMCVRYATITYYPGHHDNDNKRETGALRVGCRPSRRRRPAQTLSPHPPWLQRSLRRPSLKLRRPRASPLSPAPCASCRRASASKWFKFNIVPSPQLGSSRCPQTHKNYDGLCRPWRSAPACGGGVSPERLRRAPQGVLAWVPLSSLGCFQPWADR